MITLSINKKEITVEDGATLLDASRKAGIDIPTLCFMEGREALGGCRVCLVEVEGVSTLVPSCSTPAREGMKVFTNSKRARETRRTVLELMLSEHEGDCQYCSRGESCELRTMARNMGINEVRFVGEKKPVQLDESTPALVRDSGKCIKCRRCVRVCKQVQGVAALFPQNRGYNVDIGPAFTLNMDDIACVQCGQCAAVCPVGAIYEKSHLEQVWAALDDPTKHVVVQTAPAIRAALGECFDYPVGTLVTGKMISALRNLGFDAVFDTNFTADLTIIEEGTELLQRLRTALVDKKPAPLPQYSSCSPGWIKYAEYYFPEILPNLSTCKSPQQMFGALAKTYYATKIGVKPEDMIVVSVMPCTAKKFECQRPEMNDSGVQDVDYVLTTRELGEMIKSAGIDFDALEDGEMDAPLGLSSGAADIFANSGGVMEAALRTVYEIVTGRELPVENLHVSSIAGLDGIKEASLVIENAVDEWSFLEGVEVKVAVAHSLQNAATLIKKIQSGEATYHFVEVMTCPGGCISGGGQPRYTTDEIREARMQAIFREDEGKKLRKSHDNPDIKQIYADFLKEPLGKKSHHLLHTKYEKRPKVK